MASCYYKLKKAKEEPKHYEAFEYYMSLEDRSLLAVAKALGRSFATICSWAECFHWEERAAERDLENAKKLAIETDKKILERKKENLERLERTLKLFDKKLAEGKVDVTDLSDIAKVIQLYNSLMGEMDHGLADPVKKVNTASENVSDDKVSKVTVNITNPGENY